MRIPQYETRLKDGYAPYIRETGKTYCIDGRKALTNPKDISSFVLYEIGLYDAAEEYTYVLCFNTKNRLIGLFETSHGSCDTAPLYPREIMQKSLMLGATSIVITHNHPSGDPTPSKADIDVTQRIKNACEVIGIPLLDHVIVGLTGYYSFFEQGLLSNSK